MQNLKLRKYKNSLTIISLVWAALAAVHIFFLYYFTQINLLIAIADSLIFNLLYSLLSVGIITGLEYEGSNKPFWQRILYLYLPMLLIIVSLWTTAAYALLISIFENNNYLHFLSDSLKYRALLGFFLFSFVITVHQLIHYYQNFQQKELKATKLETELQRSKVNTLQMQMQPHFLFNALNSISALTYEDSVKTREMLIKLSNFLRYTTKYSEQHLVPLSDELAHIDQYLAIEHLRFGNRFVYKKDVTKQAYERYLPTLVLQPVFENAIKHGVNQSIEQVTIRLTSRIESDKLVIVISNTKEGGASNSKGTGTGLKNLSGRLNLLYSNRAGLYIDHKPDTFSVKLTIP